jgi:hypothetical protein
MTIDNEDLPILDFSSSNLIKVNQKFYNNLDPIPKKMYEEIYNYLEYERLNYILILDISAGLGKTFITSMITTDLDSNALPFSYFTLNHDVARQFIDFKEKVFKDHSCEHMKGKGFVEKIVKKQCERLKKLCFTCNNLKACENYRECKDEIGFKLVLKYKRNDYYCKKVCPLIKQCEHKKAIKKLLTGFPYSWSGHFLHYTSLFKIFEERWESDYDIVKIFDEDMSKSFIVRVRFSNNMLAEAIKNTNDILVINIFKKMKEGLECYNLIPFKEKDLRIQAEDEYKDEIVDLIKTIDYSTLRKEKNSYDKTIFNNFNTNLELNYQNPIDFLYEFKVFVENYHKDIEGVLTINKYFIYFDYFRLINEKNNTIILNATYESELFKRLIPKNAKVKIVKITKEFDKNQKVYALFGKRNDLKYATYPISSLIRDSYFDKKNNTNITTFTDKYYELVEKARMFSKRHKKTVIFVVKKLLNETENQFKKEIKKGSISVESFSRAVGENKYKNYDGCVILHTPYHNVEHFEKMTKLFDIDVMLAFKNYTINAIIQAIFRIRPLSYDLTKSKKCEILIFSSLEFPDLVFEKGHGIKRFRLHQFDRIFNEDYLDQIMKNILSVIKKNPNCTITEIKNLIKGSHKLILDRIQLMIEKGYISFNLDSKSSKGRPSKRFYLLSDIERKRFIEFKKNN